MAVFGYHRRLNPREFVLHDFLTTNRTLLIDRCRSMVAGRSESKAVVTEIAHGIPMFLDQLIATLALEQSSAAAGTSDGVDSSAPEMEKMAALHGRDLFEQGFTLGQVVRDYGDVCQAVTNLAFETGSAIGIREFRTFNKCLDNAIAGAVTEYARYSAVSAATDGQLQNSRLGALAHELRNYLQTVGLVVQAIKTGKVGFSGATGAVLDRSLLGMSHLIDQALADVRISAAMTPRLQVVDVASFIKDVEAAAVLDSHARSLRLEVIEVEDGLAVYADPEMLASALSNLLQNAFKFTKHDTEVRLHAYGLAGRVLIDVEDRCGGLPSGAADRLFAPFVQIGKDRSGIGLGLDICRRNVEANNGTVRVQDVPGWGCIFTIDLPRLPVHDGRDGC